MGKKFLILFSGHEGSSALISYLSNFIYVYGFEPFEYDYFSNYNDGDFPILFEYLSTENREKFDEKYRSMGPKIEQSPFPPYSFCFKIRTDYITDQMIGTLKKHDITVFVLSRKDKLKHSLSSMDPQLQFVGETISSKRIYDTGVFKEKYKEVLTINELKETAYTKLITNGVNTSKIYYEDMLADKTAFIKNILTRASVHFNDFDGNTVLSTCEFKKVHPDDVREFVQNYDDIMQAYDEVSNTDRP